MRPPGFQWYVAWRYLMARPRKVSPVLLAITLLLSFMAAWAALVSAVVLDGYDGEFGDLHEVSEGTRTTLRLLLGGGVVAAIATWRLAVRFFRREHRVDVLFVFELFLIALGMGWMVVSYFLWGSEQLVLYGESMDRTSKIAMLVAVFWLIMLVVRYYFTFFTTVSIGGVFIGTMALVIVLSVMNGFEQDLRDKILGSNAHLLVQRAPEDIDGRKRSRPVLEYREVMTAIADVEGVIGSSPYLTSEVVIGASSSYSNVIIKGVDPRTVGDVTDLKQNLQEEDSLARMWPLAEDGALLGPPVEVPDTDTGSDTAIDPDADDKAPDDFAVSDDDPIDYTAGEPPPEYPDEPEVTDPAPDDFIVPDDDTPVDFSAGHTPPPPEYMADPLELPFPDDFDDPFDDPEPIGDSPWPDWLEEYPTAFTGTGFAGTRRFASSSPQTNILDGVLVGRELVRNLHLYVGQEVSLISPLGQMTPAGPAPKSKPYRVAGTFYTGMYEYDTKVIYVELSSLQRFLSKGDEVEGIEIRVSDPEETEGVKAAIATVLGDDYIVKDWKEINRNLFSALQLEKIAMFLVLAIIILVASFSIVGNLIMVVVEKVREIALIKTLGASNDGIRRIFVIQGFFIGLVGTTVGVSCGLVVCWLGKTYGLPLDPDVYYIDRLPIAVEGIAIGAVVAAGLIISVVATLYPAALAARTRPAEGLRYE